MTGSLRRIAAIATKEWRLNSRFPIEFIVSNLTNPIKSGIMMCFLYSGFFRTTQGFIGSLTHENYIVYVFLGTVLHGQLSSSITLFRGQMTAEKYWQTATATLLTPVSIFEVIAGFMIGSGAVTVLMNVIILSIITVFFPVTLKLYFASIAVLIVLSIFGFGLGLIGATIALCWEGKNFVFDYFVQGITFLSCFYYPIEIMPKFLRPIVEVLPTYQIGQALHMLYTSNEVAQLPMVFAYLILACICIMIPAGYFFDSSVRKYGVVGY